MVERKAVQVLVLKRDRELADRDRQMQELRKQLGKTRGSKGKALPPKPSTVEEQHEESPHSRGSSTWGASDDEELEERPKPQKQASPMRQPSSVFEDNQAKLKSKGAYGASLGDLRPPPPPPPHPPGPVLCECLQAHNPVVCITAARRRLPPDAGSGELLVSQQSCLYCLAQQVWDALP